MTIQHVAVIGAGAMGAGIAQVVATQGLAVRLHDPVPGALERAQAGIAKSLARLVKAGSLTEPEAAAAHARLHLAPELADAVHAADLVIEAAPEDRELKCALFRELDRLSPPHAILASNTSQLSVTMLAACTGRAGQVLGMHWFNPPPVMKLVELVTGVATSEATLAAIQELSQRLGKETVVCKDSQGFITSRALGAHMMECLRIHEEGLASTEDIDKAIRLGLNYPMGPCELADYVGLDVLYHASLGMVEAYGDRHRAPQTLVKLVEAGHLGRKTGRGYYTYDAAGNKS